MDYLKELTERYPALEQMREPIYAAYVLLKECYESGHKLLVAGNGGSAADSEHIVGELMKGFKKKRPLPQEVLSGLEKADPEMGKRLAQKLQEVFRLSLTGHPGLSTAFLNDVDGQMVYAQQVLGYGEAGDVFWESQHREILPTSIMLV